MVATSSQYVSLFPLRADDSGADTVLLLDDQTFEVMDRFQLDCTEARPRCESISSAVYLVYRRVYLVYLA